MLTGVRNYRGIFSPDIYSNERKSLYKVVAVLWFACSVLHIFPRIFSMTNALSGDIASIKFLFPETNPVAMETYYPNEVKVILVTFGQHGFNLFWFGLITLVCALLIWRDHNKIALLIAAIVSGLAYLGALSIAFMIGSIDVWEVLIFFGTFVAIFLSLKLLKSKPG